MANINEAMIFAAGFGKRMFPFTKEIPKPLLKINGKPIIFYIIEDLINLNFKNIVKTHNAVLHNSNRHLFFSIQSEFPRGFFTIQTTTTKPSITDMSRDFLGQFVKFVSLISRCFVHPFASPF